MANQNTQKSRAILEVEVKSDIRKATDDLNQFSEAENRAAQSTSLLGTGLAGLASIDLSSLFKPSDLKTVIDTLRDFPRWIKQIFDGFKGFTPFLRSFDEIQHELNMEARLKFIREVQIEIHRVSNEIRQVQAEIDELNRKEEEFIRSGPPPGVDPRGGGFVSSFNLKRGLLEDRLLTLQLEKDRYVEILGELRTAQNAESQSNEELTDSLARQASATATIRDRVGETAEAYDDVTLRARKYVDVIEAAPVIPTIEVFKFPETLEGPTPEQLDESLQLYKEYLGQLFAATDNTLGMIALEEIEFFDRLKELYKEGGIDYEEFLKRRDELTELFNLKRRKVEEETARGITEEQQRAFEQMAQKIESFFQQVFLTARSFSDVWKQLLQQLLRLFVSFVAKMIAAWLSGMKSLRSTAGGILGDLFGAGTGGGGLGGILGSIFGPIFSLATGGLFGLRAAGVGGTGTLTPGKASIDTSGLTLLGPIPTTEEVLAGNFMAAAGGTDLLGAGLSAGAGITTGALGSASRVAEPGGASAGFLARLGTGNIAGLLSTGALTFGGLLLGRGGPVSGAFGGALLGAGGIIAANLIGAAITGTSLGTIGSFLGAAFSGPFAPIVIGVAALLGGIFGALSRGKKKRQATKIANEGFAEMTKVIEQFKKFEVDFESALASLNSIWDRMVAAWQQIGGKVGKRSIRSQRPFFEEKVRELEGIQAAREARGQLEAFGIIPEFAVGGFVNDAVRSITSSQGKILAFLHQGEAVLNARAVQSLGRSFIESANRAPGFQQGGFSSPLSNPVAPATGITLNITINPAPGMNEEALAGRVVRRIRRELRDQGI